MGLDKDVFTFKKFTKLLWKNLRDSYERMLSWHNVFIFVAFGFYVIKINTSGLTLKKAKGSTWTLCGFSKIVFSRERLTLIWVGFLGVRFEVDEEGGVKLPV